MANKQNNKVSPTFNPKATYQYKYDDEGKPYKQYPTGEIKELKPDDRIDWDRYFATVYPMVQRHKSRILQETDWKDYQATPDERDTHWWNPIDWLCILRKYKKIGEAKERLHKGKMSFEDIEKWFQASKLPFKDTNQQDSE